MSFQITIEDFYYFDYILAMDYPNFCELEYITMNLSPPTKAKIERLGSYLPLDEDIEEEQEIEKDKKSNSKKDVKDKKGDKDDKKGDKNKEKAVEKKDNEKDKKGKKGDKKEEIVEEVIEGMGEEEEDLELVADPRDIPDPYFVSNIQ